tara:strand:+ start:5309 stop:6142 length:834 start_codon:yes stop_codon:yes gene_type:complete
MKIKHNKKRNTAFVYESIVKEATVAILKGDNTGKDRAIKILRKHFAHGSVLHRHLDCYRSLYKNQSIEKEMSEKILREAKLASRLLDSEGLFIKQTDLINDVNKELSSEVFSNFVPNYKTLATIDQIFSGKLSPKNSIILESQVIQNMSHTGANLDNWDVVDNIVYSSFVHKFNKKYNTGLLQEQKQLLNHYISSFSDNALSLKSFLNTEIGRLKEALQAALEVDAIKDDSAMVKKTTQIIEKLDSFYKEQISDTVLLTVLKTQALVQEIFDHGDKS